MTQGFVETQQPVEVSFSLDDSHEGQDHRGKYERSENDHFIRDEVVGIGISTSFSVRMKLLKPEELRLQINKITRASRISPLKVSDFNNGYFNSIQWSQVLKLNNLKITKFNL